MGRRTKYREEYASQVEAICEQFGATDEQIAKVLNVSVSTLNLWKAKHAEFSESLKRGKVAYDSRRVEASVLKCAIGFTYLHEQYDPGYVNQDGTTGAIIQLQRYHPPAYKQQLLWLHNREGWHCPAPPRASVAANVIEAGSGQAIEGEGNRWSALAEDLKLVARGYLEDQLGTRLRLPEVRDAEIGPPAD